MVRAVWRWWQHSSAHAAQVAGSERQALAKAKSQDGGEAGDEDSGVRVEWPKGPETEKIALEFCRLLSTEHHLVKVDFKFPPLERISGRSQRPWILAFCYYRGCIFIARSCDITKICAGSKSLRVRSLEWLRIQNFVQQYFKYLVALQSMEIQTVCFVMRFDLWSYWRFGLVMGLAVQLRKLVHSF